MSWQGDWDGPWSLRRQINVGSNDPPRFSEIAHAVLLPPPNEGWVVLWCARYCSDLGPTVADYKTFLWDPATPNSLVTLPVPPVSPPGSADLFCSGHMLNEDGLLIVFGGTNVDAGCIGSPPPAQYTDGHTTVWILDTSIQIDVAQGILPQWIENANDMARKRWYGDAIQLADGRILVDGHGGTSSDSPPTAATREYGRVLLPPQPLSWDQTPTGSFIFRNWRWPAPVAGDCTMETGQGGDVQVPGYQRVVQLANADVLHVLTRQNQVPNELSVLLDFDRCPVSSTDDGERFIDMASTANLPQIEGAPVGVYIDASVFPPQGLVYSVGGSGTETNCSAVATDAVRTLAFDQYSDPSTLGWNVGPKLIDRRNASNFVIGLDGSGYVIGGIEEPAQPGLECIAHHEPERLRPSLIFKTGLQDTWELMCPQVHDRWYHSVALLLPNGRILSGGGVMPDDSTHSLESFGPPYLYQEDPPPVILQMDIPPVEVPVKAPGAFLQLSVDLPGGKFGEFRVALIQPGSVTHSTNTSPRYVKLVNDDFTPMGQGVPTTISVTIPSSNNIVPPGYYMISVTSSDGVPSAARWVKITR